MIYFILVAVISLIALVATFAVGFSKQNQSEDDHYTKESKKNMLRLTLLNGLYVLILVIVLLVYIKYFQ